MNDIVFKFFVIFLVAIACAEARGSQDKELYRKEIGGGKLAKIVLESVIIKEDLKKFVHEGVEITTPSGDTELNYTLYLVDATKGSTNCVWKKKRMLRGSFGSEEILYAKKESGFIIHDVALNNTSVAVLYTNDETLYVDIISPLDATSASPPPRSIPLCSKEDIRHTTFSKLVWAKDSSSYDLYILYLFDSSGRKIFHIDQQTSHLILNESPEE